MMPNKKMSQNNNVPINTAYWDSRYKKMDSPWNAKAITTPLKEYIDQIQDKDIHILIPGVGHGHELLYLHEQGFNNIKGLDLTLLAANQTKEMSPEFPIEKVILEDFFIHNFQYDLILEQTFFCAIEPHLREKYVDKIQELLKEGGKLVGVLFDTEFDSNTPPFGGGYLEYQRLFKDKMNIVLMEKAYNSIKPRMGKELFIIIEKK